MFSFRMKGLPAIREGYLFFHHYLGDLFPILNLCGGIFFFFFYPGEDLWSVSLGRTYAQRELNRAGIFNRLEGTVLEMGSLV